MTDQSSEVSLFEAIYTQRQPVRFKPDPVPMAALEKIVEAATRAPSGANAQPWAFVVVTDRGLIAEIARIYQESWFAFWGAEPPAAGETPAHRAARGLAHRLPEIPALILACVDHSRVAPYRKPGEPIERGRYASSIFLAVQNLFLAARALGLGTRLTTAHLRREADVMKLLGIPDHVETVALIPVGYPTTPLGTPPARKPAAESTFYDRWGNGH